LSPSRLISGAIALAVLAAGPACRVREPAEAARAKATKDFLEQQLEGLQRHLARAERGELVTTDQIAIGVDEDTARQILNAPLPREQVVGEHARITFVSAEPIFRGTQAALVFRARVTSEDLPDQFAELELAGGLQDLKLVDGILAANVEILHFRVQNASVGALAGLVEGLVRANLGVIQGAIPRFEIPVRLDQKLSMDRFQEGPVSAAGGELPLSVAVSEVLALNQRLWVLLDAKAGPWSPAPAAAAKEAGR
jgi:hypothetical protein